MLQSAKLDKKFWAEALATAVQIWNPVLSRSLPENETPFHGWMGKRPDFSYLRVFGSECYYVTPKNKRKKLDVRSRPGIMLGYPQLSRCYKIWDTQTNKVIVSRDVTFVESQKMEENATSNVSADYDSVQGCQSYKTLHFIIWLLTCIYPPSSK